jgi:putative glutamine amidotransferase
MPAPLIGITTGRLKDINENVTRMAVGEAYIQSIHRVGGVCVLIPVGLSTAGLEQIYSHLDGVLITGGGDINPKLYNGKPHNAVYGIDSDRDELEIALVKLAVHQKLPFLGICRGIQVINVALGGTLFTDISAQLPGALKHDYFPGYPRDYLSHSIQVSEDSVLAGILENTSPRVNSMHHQGLDQIAQSLVPTAFAPDGLVEGIELPDHPFGIGVQWHPECLPELGSMQALFKSLVKASHHDCPNRNL